ncbi:DJ-1/PfpI family protein [Actinomadura fibrosa]|uniref:DJ-1/PfpI family protein n=1 Tax=Actinomadura fibrosa TaxID=111802 RepID=A0ABW2XFJ2_9ACTN|nr:DJ-1/PfpI family protein [Actinomadura fibrosa]
MTDQPTDRSLAGARVAVLVESQYIPGELRQLQEGFAAYGAEVDLVSRLWGQPSLHFYSTVEPAGEDDVPPIEWIEVSIDVDDVRPSDYDAVVAVANYPTVRMRYLEAPESTEAAAEAVRQVPAVRFMRDAMRDRRVVKAAPCHALWLLTPCPDVLAGRRVTCNGVLIADVLNAGAVYTPPPAGAPAAEQVVVDDDLVTSTSWHATAKLIDTVRDLVVDRRRSGVPERSGRGRGGRAGRADRGGEPDSVVARAFDLGAEHAEPARREGGTGHRRGKVLTVLSEWGYWGEELVGPLDELDRAGYAVDFCTPNGRRPNAIPVSMDADFFDPPLQRPVTSPEMAARVREMDDPSTEQGARLENPISLAGWFPQRPPFAHPQFVRLLEEYRRDLGEAERRAVDEYDAVLLVGGSGPIVDMVNNQRVHDLILAFHKAGKPIAAECYGVACLAFARDMNQRRSILEGKHVTGHCLEYDYQDGTHFVEARGRFLDFNMGPPPYPLEFMLRDATAPGGAYHGNFGSPVSVIVDYPFVTGRSTGDSVLTGRKLVEVLDEGLRRWGW